MDLKRIEIEERIQVLKKSRAEVYQNLYAHNGAIEELENLLNPKKKEEEK
jgi:hypothetical protein